MIEIKDVKGKRMLKEFIDFPCKLYKDSPYFTPYIYEDEVDNLTPSRNPASKYCEFKPMLAYKDGKIVGRICGIINNFANEKYNRKRVRFNRIDMIDDIEVTKALINAVEEFGKSRGMNEICGPLGFSDQDKEGMLVKGFEEMNCFMTFYTYPYYVDHMEKLGFVQDAKWVEKRVFIPKELNPRFTRVADYVRNKFNFYVDDIKSKKELTEDVVVEVLSLTNECYKDLYGYVPIDEKQMHALAKQYITLINLKYLFLVRDQDKKLVAYGLLIPSPVKALKRHNGHLFPIGFIDFLAELKKSKVLDMLLVSVEPRYQSYGVMALIFEKAVQHAIEDGIQYAETGPQLEYNKKVQSLWNYFEHIDHKERVCFLKKIDL